MAEWDPRLRIFARSLCHCVTVPLCHCATVPLCHCATVPLCHCVTVPLCMPTVIPMLTTLLLAATLSISDYATLPQISTPRFSPDGARIAYVVTKADLEKSAYDSDVWLINVDGSDDRQLTFASGSDEEPRWAPDSQRLAFLSDRSGRSAIHLMDVRGGESRAITDEPTSISSFAWSPDGTRIAFTRAEPPSAE